MRYNTNQTDMGEPEVKKGLRITRRRVFIGSVILTMATVVGFIGYMNKPAYGTVQTNNPQLAVANESSKPSFLSIKGRYLSFSYPSAFTRIPAAKPTGTQLEIFSFTKSPSPFWFMNAEVNTLTSGNLADDGSYNMRRLNPSRFKLDKWVIGSKKIDVFSDNSGGYAKSAFIAKGHELFSVSVTSSDILHTSELDSSLRGVLTSLEWNK